MSLAGRGTTGGRGPAERSGTDTDLRAVRDERYVLAIDLGTGGPKVGFVSLGGRLAWQEHTRVETRWIGSGGAVQDANEWWAAICDATRRGLASGAVAPAAVVAVCVTGMWACTVPVDEAGEPVGEAQLWMDSRGGPYSKKVIGGPVAGYAPRPALQWIHRSGGAPSTSGADPKNAFSASSSKNVASITNERSATISESSQSECSRCRQKNRFSRPAFPPAADSHESGHSVRRSVRILPSSSLMRHYN